MTSSSKLARFVAHMDGLYEYDREPVSRDDLKPGRYFAGLFAGEHVAATEFVIGAFFVLHGVELRDLVFGLLLGNLLAVLSWTFVCAPIATDTRLTLYWYLRRIAGPAAYLRLQHCQCGPLLRSRGCDDCHFGDGARPCFRHRDARFDRHVPQSTLTVCYFMPLHLYYRWLPGYGTAIAAYLALRLRTLSGNTA